MESICTHNTHPLRFRHARCLRGGTASHLHAESGSLIGKESGRASYCGNRGSSIAARPMLAVSLATGSMRSLALKSIRQWAGGL